MVTTTMVAQNNSSSISGFIAGAISGAVGIILPFPLESYRLRSLYKIKTEIVGPLMFKGLTAALAQGVMLRGVSFGVYDHALKILSPQGDFMRDPLWHFAVAGSLSSLSLSWIREPFGCFRSRVQAGTTTEKSFVKFFFSNMLDQKGRRSLYAGFVSSSVTSMVSRGSYFWTYELGKRFLFANSQYFKNVPGMKVEEETGSPMRSTKNLPLGMRVLAATLSGPFSWVIIYPFDVVRSRMRAMDPNAFPPAYSSFYDCFQKTAKEGYLFRGLGLTVMRSAPMASITLPLYESIYIELDKVFS